MYRKPCYPNNKISLILNSNWSIDEEEVDLILTRYKDLIIELEQFVYKVNENTLIEDIIGYMDHILIKLLILFIYKIVYLKKIHVLIL